MAAIIQVGASIVAPPALDGWSLSDYGAELILGNEQSDTVETDYSIFWASGGAGLDAFDYVQLVADSLWTRVIQNDHFTGDTATPSWDDGAFTGTTKVWFRHAFKFSTNWESGISYKFHHQYFPGGGVTARLRVEIEDGGWTFGWVGTGLGSWSNTRLVPTHMAQPANTTDLDTLNVEDTIVPTDEWWEMIVCIERMASPTVDGMTRCWVRQYTQSGVVDPGNWYFNGAYHTGGATDYPLTNRVRLGVNRNEAPLADEYIKRGRYFIVDGTQDNDPWGVDSMRP